MKTFWSNLKNGYINRRLAFLFWLARCVLPKRLVSICAVQVAAEASVGIYSNTEIPTLTAMQASDRYAKLHKLNQ